MGEMGSTNVLDSTSFAERARTYSSTGEAELMRTMMPSVQRLSAAIAFGGLALAGCGAATGGQSFDDGSGDLGPGSRRAGEPQAPSTLMDPTTLRITSELPVLPSSSFVGDLDQDGWAEFVVATAGADGDPENGVARSAT
jgi:hypothetical protein